MQKDFKTNNPAEALIRNSQQPKQTTKGVGRPKSTEETKDKRTNMLFYPSIYEGLKKIAYIKQTSVNDIINELARDYVNKHHKEVQKYDEIF